MNSDVQQPVRVVLFGLGRMGRHHFNVINNHPEFQLVALVDPSQDKTAADLVKSRQGVPRFGELAEVPDSLVYDCAVVASPTETHYDLVTALLRKQKHVLVEKPAASTYEQTVTLAQLAAERALHLCVGHVERFNPAAKAMLNLHQSGLFGQLLHINSMRAGGFPQSVQSGNHVILDLAVHDLDIARMLLGPLETRSSYLHANRQQHIFDSADMLLASKSGTSVALHVNWFTPSKQRSMRLVGTVASAEVDFMEPSIHYMGPDVAPMAGLGELVEDTMDAFGCRHIRYRFAPANPLAEQLSDFRKLLTDQAHVLCSGAALTESVYLVEQVIAKSQHEHTWN